MTRQEIIKKLKEIKDEIAINRESELTEFARILYEMEKMHKRKHEVNFILISDDVRYVDFDRVMGIPIERATLPKGVQFVVAERKEKEE